MYLNQHIIAKISAIFSQITMPVMLLDNGGQVILPETNNRSLPLPEELLANPFEPYVNGAFTLIGTYDSDPMFLCLSGYSEEVKSCAKLCAQLVNMALKDEGNIATEDNTIRLILDGEIDRNEMEALCAEQQLDVKTAGTVIYAHFTQAESKNVVGIIRNLIMDGENDYVCEVGRHAVAIVKSITEDIEGDEIQQYAEALQNTFISETGSTALIGIGGVKASLLDMHESLLEARKAINIGRKYHPKNSIFNYGKMVIERFLADIPEDKALAFYQTLFNRKNQKLFSDEMISTIETFFENSLNLSETARQLYIHRNTLVYRLDKIQKCVGLDLRAFDDAVTFKLLMLIGKQKNDKKTRI